MGGPVQGIAYEGAEDHDRNRNEEEGDDLGDGRVGDEMFEQTRHVLVVPTGEQNAGNKAAKREELKNNSAHEGHDDGVSKHGEEEPVEEIHAVLGIGEIGTPCNQAEGFEIFFARAGRQPRLEVRVPEPACSSGSIRGSRGRTACRRRVCGPPGL